MGKNKNNKTGKGGGGGGESKGGGASSSSSSSSIFIVALVGILASVVLQALLTSGAIEQHPLSALYDALTVPDASPPPLKTKRAKKQGEKAKPAPVPSGKPAVCPEGWADCPRVAGADWVSLEQLEASPFAMPSAEALEACHAPHSLLSPRPVPGMHLLCLLPPPKDDSAGAVATLAIWRDMLRRPTPSAVLLLPQLASAEQALAALKRKLALPKKRSNLYQPPALFTETGVRLQSAGGLSPLSDAEAAEVAAEAAEEGGDAAATFARRLLCMEGGQWLWPPVEVGFVHKVKGLTAPDVTTRVVTLSLKPLVVEVENFLDSNENAHIIKRAAPHMEKSGVALKDADKGKAAKEFRTSSQYFLPTTRDPLLEKVDRRVSWLTRIPISHAEYIQVLKYHHLGAPDTQSPLTSLPDLSTRLNRATRWNPADVTRLVPVCMRVYRTLFCSPRLFRPRRVREQPRHAR